jgi:hypothetical protein
LRRIDVEPGALAEIVTVSVGHPFAARAGVGRDEHHAVLGAGAAVLAFLHHVGVRAGEAGEVPQHRQLAPGACSGTKTAKVISVPVAVDWCR